MFKRFKKTIEKNRNSRSLFWKSLVIIKDSIWFLCSIVDKELKKTKKGFKKIKIGLRDTIKELRIKISIRHVYGPKKIKYGINDLIVCCLIKNGEYWVRKFIEHHQSLGIRHIVFLDNGSIDKTVSIAKEYNNITIIETKLPFAKFDYLFKRYLIKKFGKKRWVLYIDMDEFFDYPFSDKIDLSCFIKYLNKNKYTTVICQMLDLISNKQLYSMVNDLGMYKYYDLSNIEKKDLEKGNEISNKNIKRYFGGIHMKFFGIQNINLTKYSLMFADNKIKPFAYSSHDIANAKIADISCVLFHYKFSNDFFKKIIKNIALIPNDKIMNRGIIKEYEQYIKVLKENPNLNLKSASSKRFHNTNELVKNGFLIISQNYSEWVKNNQIF